jgi:alpha-galactosidase
LGLVLCREQNSFGRPQVLKSKDENLLTPEKEKLFKQWLDIYNEKMLSKGIYHGELYDLGYDYPETHCIEKDGESMYFAFYNPDFSGTVELRGLKKNKRYSVVDYFHKQDLGIVDGNFPQLKINFQQFLLIEVKER